MCGNGRFTSKRKIPHCAKRYVTSTAELGAMSYVRKLTQFSKIQLNVTLNGSQSMPKSSMWAVIDDMKLQSLPRISSIRVTRRASECEGLPQKLPSPI